MKVEEIKYFIFGMTYFWTVPNILKDEFGYIRIFGTFLGKAPKYGYTVSAVRWDTYFLVNQLGHRQTQALIRTYYIIIIKWRKMCTLSFFHLLLIFLLLIIIMY